LHKATALLLFSTLPLLVIATKSQKEHLPAKTSETSVKNLLQWHYQVFF